MRAMMVSRNWPSRSAAKVAVARAADLVEEDARIGDAVGVDAVAAQADRAELLVADGDGRGRAPLLVDLQAGGEEVDFGLEGGLEGLVPVHQIGEQGKIAGIEGVQAGAEDVGDLAFVDEGGHLRLAHGELAAVFYLHVPHGIAIGKDAVFRLIPLNDAMNCLPRNHEDIGVLFGRRSRTRQAAPHA
jgi:hypothetical protein